MIRGCFQRCQAFALRMLILILSFLGLFAVVCRLENRVTVAGVETQRSVSSSASRPAIEPGHGYSSYEEDPEEDSGWEAQGADDPIQEQEIPPVAPEIEDWHPQPQRMDHGPGAIYFEHVYHDGAISDDEWGGHTWVENEPRLVNPLLAIQTVMNNAFSRAVADLARARALRRHLSPVQRRALGRMTGWLNIWDEHYYYMFMRDDEDFENADAIAGGLAHRVPVPDQPEGHSASSSFMARDNVLSTSSSIGGTHDLSDDADSGQGGTGMESG